MRYPYFTDGSNELDASDSQRTINLMPELVGPAGKNQARLIGTPGLTLIDEAVASATSVRGIFEGDQSGLSYFYAAIDDHLYKVKTDISTVSDLGSIGNDADNTPISYATGGVSSYTLIVSNGTAYSLKSGVLAAVSGLAAITCLDCTYLNGYWIVITSSKTFMRSGVGDIDTWDAADYDYPDTQTEDLVGCEANNGQLWFFGKTRTNVWMVDSTTDIGFSPLQGVVIHRGCKSKDTVKLIDNALCWLADTQNGIAQVVIGRSYSPTRISTHWVEDIITDNKAALDTAYGIVTEENGHEVYWLCIPGAETAPCWDAATQRWHERAYGETSYGIPLAKCYMVKDNARYVGARNSGNIYTLSMTAYDDDGEAIKRLRRAPHISNEDKPVTYGSFRLDVEKSLGTDGANPQMYLRYSNNGGKTYSSAIGASIGETDDDPNTICVEWHRLGTGADYVFEVYTTAANRICINNAYIN